MRIDDEFSMYDREYDMANMFMFFDELDERDTTLDVGEDNVDYGFVDNQFIQSLIDACDVRQEGSKDPEETTVRIDAFRAIDDQPVKLTIGEYNTIKEGVTTQIQQLTTEVNSLRERLEERTEERDAISDSLVAAQGDLTYQRQRNQELFQEVLTLRPIKREVDARERVNAVHELMMDIVLRRDTDNLRTFERIVRSSGGKIDAIKKIREEFADRLSMGLREAKELVETYLVVQGYYPQGQGADVFFSGSYNKPVSLTDKPYDFR